MAFRESNGSDVHGSTFNEVRGDQININYIINHICSDLKDLELLSLDGTCRRGHEVPGSIDIGPELPSATVNSIALGRNQAADRCSLISNLMRLNEQSQPMNCATCGPGSSAAVAIGLSTPSTDDVSIHTVLDMAVAARGQNLAWRTSIVDLMKVLKLDPSLAARKKLAAELRYDGDLNESSEVNLWLHKRIMMKLMESGYHDVVALISLSDRSFRIDSDATIDRRVAAVLLQSDATISQPTQVVDLDVILDKAVAAKGQKLAWRTSVVDLMKALELDSSLTARKKLVTKLRYHDGDTNSREMNLWLHKQIMMKLRESGGEVPNDLRP